MDMFATRGQDDLQGGVEPLTICLADAYGHS